MKLTPQGNRILVLLIEEKETESKVTKLKLILPDQKDSYGMPQKGKIIAVGIGEKCVRMDFKEGDIVYFSKWAGQPMKISPRTFATLEENFEEGKTYLFLNTKDIYGRIYEKKTKFTS